MRRRWITSAAAAAEVRVEQDRYDREVLGIEPLGKPASQATREERAAYDLRRSEAIERHRKDDARERARKANIARAEKGRAGEMEVSDADSLSGAG